MSTRTTIEETHAGRQLRAYAGDTWEGTITFEMKGEDGWVPWAKVPESHVRKIVAFLTGFQEHGEGDWYTPRLKHLNTQGAMHVWHYLVERPYDD